MGGFNTHKHRFKDYISLWNIIIVRFECDIVHWIQIIHTLTVYPKKVKKKTLKIDEKYYDIAVKCL